MEQKPAPEGPRKNSKAFILKNVTDETIEIIHKVCTDKVASIESKGLNVEDVKDKATEIYI